MAEQIERYDAQDITVIFEGGRCIHSRMCVLGLPGVFVPNAVGPWIHPETASAEAVAAIAQSCPSGAIRYERHDGAAQESPPDVNTVRIRENGPLAFHAELAVAGDRSAYRATLSSCGGLRGHGRTGHSGYARARTTQWAARGHADTERSFDGRRLRGDRLRHGPHGRKEREDIPVPLRRLAEQTLLRRCALENRFSRLSEPSADAG
jgi:uncharacterized Fe-S cluster protein YjdI